MEPAERRKSILEAAKKAFALKGYHSAGVADIIEEASIARGTFYLYFKSKRDVFSALADYIVQSIDERLVPMSFRDQDAILDTLKRNLEGVKNFFLDDPDLAKILMLAATALDPESSAWLAEIRERLIRWMSDLVSQAQERGILKPMDPDLIATAFFGAVRELVENIFIRGELDSGTDKATQSILELFIFGLIAQDYRKAARDNLRQVTEEE